jgi:putative flippase GtrA
MNKYLSPRWWFLFLYKLRAFHFAFVGGSTFLLHVGLTVIFEKFWLGAEKFYYAYTLALVLSLLYNFVMHTIVTYKTKKRHLARFGTFVVYTVIINIFQNIFVKLGTNHFGVAYRYYVMAGVIILQSIADFFYLQTLVV